MGVTIHLKNQTKLKKKKKSTLFRGGISVVNWPNVLFFIYDAWFRHLAVLLSTSRAHLLSGAHSIDFLLAKLLDLIVDLLSILKGCQEPFFVDPLAKISGCKWYLWISFIYQHGMATITLPVEINASLIVLHVSLGLPFHSVTMPDLALRFGWFGVTACLTLAALARLTVKALHYETNLQFIMNLLFVPRSGLYHQPSWHPINTLTCVCSACEGSWC